MKPKKVNVIKENVGVPKNHSKISIFSETIGASVDDSTSRWQDFIKYLEKFETL